MTLTAIMNNALTGLFASQTGLRVTSNNVANANTPGYYREIITQEAIVTNGSGGGVSITSITAAVDKFIETASIDANSSASKADTVYQFLDRLQGLIGKPGSDNNIAGHINQMFANFSSLSLNPADRIQRTTLLTAMNDLAGEISHLADAVQGLRGEANQQISETITRANELIKDIADLNPQIANQTAQNKENGTLIGQRARALQELSQIMDIRVNAQANGMVYVTSGGGINLVDNSYAQLSYNGSGVASSQSLFPEIELTRIDYTTGLVTKANRTLDSSISGGKLGALIQLRDTDLRHISLEIGNLAAGLMHELNAVHNSYSAVPAPNSLTGKQTALNAGSAPNFTGKVTFAVTGANNQTASSVTIDFDNAAPATMGDLINAVNAGLGGAGTLSLSGGVLKFSAADPTGGVVISDDATVPSLRGDQGFSQFFGMNDLLISSVGGDYATGFKIGDNHNLDPAGTAHFVIVDSKGHQSVNYTMTPPGSTWGDVIADLNASPLGLAFDFSLDSAGRLVTTPKPGSEEARLEVTDDSSNVAGSGIPISRLFGIGDFALADAAKGLQVNPRILADPGQMALSQFDAAAAPPKASLSSGDNSGLLEFGLLETKLTVFKAAGGLSKLSVTIGQYAGTLLSDMGTRAQRAKVKSDEATAINNDMHKRLEDETGVNIDEELSAMVMYQNSYAATTRLITAVKDMYDDLLRM